MAHFHGGSYDPNARSPDLSGRGFDPNGRSYDPSGRSYDPNSPSNNQQPPHSASRCVHGGGYTPGASHVWPPDQVSTHSHKPHVSPSQSPLSAQSSGLPASPGTPGHQQSFGQVQTQNSMQYYEHPMAYNGQQQQSLVYYQETVNRQQVGTMQPRDVVPVSTVPLSLLNSSEANEKAEKEFPTNLKGSRHFFEPRTVFQRYNPTLYQKPGYNFTDCETKMRYRDYAGRISFKTRSDCYLHYHDGYLRTMCVAATDEIFEGPGTSTWKRTYVRKAGPLKVRIATWVFDFSYDPQSWKDWGIMVLRALPAGVAMTFVFWDGARVMRRHLLYAPVLYKFYGDVKVWSNPLENHKGHSLMARNKQVYQVLRPRYLCFLREPFNDENRGVEVRNTAEWENSVDGQDANLGYLFVAYSNKHFAHDSEQDMDDLHHIGETACQAAKLPAYWVACSCMRDENEMESDVYRISDVLRGASSMIIAVGRGESAVSGGKITTDRLLREWGSRMWTFPEVLLSPGHTISVYTRGRDLKSPLVVAKNQFAAQVWTYVDPDIARHLIDHYLGTISLSRLEQAVLALKCLYSRQTTEYLPGDHAYALMGLLRLRPQIDRTDTAFQAFARLSLANDSDRLLERYICTLPIDDEQPWFDMNDTYQSSLWDIMPYCQVAGIADNDTIVIDGAWGLSIMWDAFYPVYWSTGPALKRSVAAYAVELNGVFLILAIGFLAGGATSEKGLIALGVIFLLLFLWVLLMTPGLVRVIYSGKFADTQAEMFGFEGHLNAPTIERAIFGGDFRRFCWSTSGSPLSRSVVNRFGERIGIDPCKDPEVRMKVETAKHARPGDKRIFTLVDTYNMELTLFEAVRPPITLMFCASESGMQRALGCSYEWETSTMYRETVLRMPTTALNRMVRVPRFRLGIRRPVYPSAPCNGDV